MHFVNAHVLPVCWQCSFHVKKLLVECQVIKQLRFLVQDIILLVHIFALSLIFLYSARALFVFTKNAS